MISGLSLGLSGAIGPLLAGWLGDRVSAVLPAARVLLPAISLLIAMLCVVTALQQPKGSVDAFMFLMAASTALALYFFVMYVFGASFGTTITGALSDYFAAQAMVAAGASEMAEVFRATATQCDVSDPRLDVVVFGVAVRRGPNHSGRYAGVSTDAFEAT